MGQVSRSPRTTEISYGTVVPLVGNVPGAVVGGVIGGVLGAWGRETIAKGAFDTVRGWFN